MIFTVPFLLPIRYHILIPGRLVAFVFEPLLLSSQLELSSLFASEKNINFPLTDNVNKLLKCFHYF